MTTREKTSGLFTAALLLTFIILKLTGTIDWSWWWVLAPAWMPVALGLLLVLVILVFYELIGRKHR